MSSTQRVSFAYCKCFLSQNVYLPKYALYVDYFEDDSKFKREYQALILEIDIESSLQIAKQEIKRRFILRENVLQRVQLVKERYLEISLKVNILKPNYFRKQHSSSSLR